MLVIRVSSHCSILKKNSQKYAGWPSNFTAPNFSEYMYFKEYRNNSIHLFFKPTGLSDLQVQHIHVNYGYTDNLWWYTDKLK